MIVSFHSVLYIFVRIQQVGPSHAVKIKFGPPIIKKLTKFLFLDQSVFWYALNVFFQVQEQIVYHTNMDIISFNHINCFRCFAEQISHDEEKIRPELSMFDDVFEPSPGLGNLW